MAMKIMLKGVEIRADSRELVVHGELRHLSWRSFDVLLVLADNAGSVVEKERLLQGVWGGTVVDESNLTQAVTQIRKALGEFAPGRSYIETIPRIGYRISPDAVEVPDVPTLAAHAADSSESVPSALPAQKTPGWKSRILALASAGALVAAAYVVTVRPPGSGATTETVEVPFTSFDGDEWSGSFTPDGREVVFTWAKANGAPDIYFKSLESEVVRPFVVSDSAERGPVVSPDGRFVAFIRLGAHQATVLIKPRDGGPERAVTQVSIPHASLIATPGPYLTWTTDSGGLIYANEKRLYLWRLSESRAIQLTQPPETAPRGDADPALSPDGRTLLFVRDVSNGASDLYRLPLSAKFEPAGQAQLLLSNGHWNRSPAWHPDGRRIVFNSGQWGRPRLWFLSLDRPSSARPIPGAGADAHQPALSPITGQIIYTRWNDRQQIWTTRLSRPDHMPEPVQPLFTSTRVDGLPQLSRDGSQIVFQSDRTGSYEVWISRTDGSELRRVTSFGGKPSGSPDLSPDGKEIVFDRLVDGHRDIFICDVHGGNLRQLTDHPAEDIIPRWSADGKSIYFATHRDGPSTIYKADAQSGHAVRVTATDGALAQESPDGKTLYFVGADSVSADLFAMPVAGGPARRVISGLRQRAFSVNSNGIYFVPASGEPEVRLLNVQTGAVQVVLTVPNRKLTFVAADIAGRVLAVSLRGDPPGDLMLLRGLPAN